MVAVAPQFSHVRPANDADRELLRQWALAPEAVRHRSSIESAAAGALDSTTYILLAMTGAPAALAVTRFHLFNFVYRPIAGAGGAGRVVAATTIDEIFVRDPTIEFVEAGGPISNEGHDLLMGLGFEYEEIGDDDDHLDPVARVPRAAWLLNRPALLAQQAILPLHG